MKYCADTSPKNGWLCILANGHKGAHLSIDNTRLWKGTPGFPVFWGEPATPKADDLPREVTEDFPRDPTSEELEPTAIQQFPGHRPGTTGIPCDQCQSMNTIRSGTCLLCLDCNHAGECG